MFCPGIGKGEGLGKWSDMGNLAWPASAPSYSGHNDDDIQEVMPTVETEPLQAAAAVPEPYQQQEQGGQLQQVDDGMGYDEEGYEDYGQYGADGGYEGTLVDADGNKGKLPLYPIA